MTDFTTLKMRDAEVPKIVAGTTTVFYTINPANLASYPAASDTIAFFDLPKGVRIVDAALRVSGDIAANTSTVQLQAKQDSTTINLTDTLAATAAGSKRMNVAAPAVNNDYVTTIQVAVATAALDASGDIEVMVQYV